MSTTPGPRPLTFTASVALACVALVSCSQAGRADASAGPAIAGPRIIRPAGAMAPVTWTAEELARPVAARRIGATDGESMHLIHVGGAEPPHTHDQHDVVVVMLSGSAMLHLGDATQTVRPGDVMEIPRGVVHWAENTAPGGSVVYAVFTPPYDGTDMHPLPK